MTKRELLSELNKKLIQVGKLEKISETADKEVESQKEKNHLLTDQVSNLGESLNRINSTMINLTLKLSHAGEHIQKLKDTIVKFTVKEYENN